MDAEWRGLSVSNSLVISDPHHPRLRMSLNSDQVDEIILQAKASPVFLEESEGFTCKKQDYKERLGRKKSGDFV